MRGLGLAVAVLVLVLVGGAARAEEPKWGPHVDLEGKAGTDRNLGEADLFLPVVQDRDTLLFASLRTRLDDEGSREGNFGLGLRQMLDSGWNLGTYGYFDRRRTDAGSLFNQATLGVEALGQDWDLRANGYIGLGSGRRRLDSATSGGDATAALAGNTVQVTVSDTLTTTWEERALSGFDAEIGWRVPVFAADSGAALRVYGGGYRFSADGVPDVAGPRGRLDLTFDEVPHLWEGSRLSLGAEVQHDDPRGGQGFLSARLRIPLQVFGQPSSALTAQERRMADPIVRDVDIVSSGVRPTTTVTAVGYSETATTAGGGAITVLDGASTANLPAAVAAAGVGSTVILSGTFNTTDTVALQSSQTVMGQGDLRVRSPSGRTATLTASAGATIAATLTPVAAQAAVAMANGSTLRGITVTANNTGVNVNSNVYGIEVNGVSGAVIAGNTVTATSPVSSAIAIRLFKATDITVDGNAVTAINTNSGGGTAIAVQMVWAGGVAATATVSGNTLSASAFNGYALYIDDSTPLPGSAGNVVLAGGCAGSGSGGPIDYVDALGASHTCRP
ncbi:MAG: inverse autotransporter beta domain-containing protein [Magnetospirillum sp.]|nr:inverse autotransporter beta domain-containing protein [Magnetospirillum sp.]